MPRMTRVLALLAIALVPSLATAQDQYQPPPEQYPQQQYQPPQEAQYAGQPGYDDAAMYDQQMQYGYFGPHPEPYDQGSAVCPIEGPHFHPYPPFDRYLFREANGYFYFVGDLGDFGYQGQMWGYQGNHPLPVEYGGGYCYIDWPHRHPFPPPPSMQFNFVGGYYTYAGPWDPAYWAHRAAWMGYFGGYYRSNYFGGRYWSVRPRPVYARTLGWGARGVYRPGVTVYAPGGHRITVGRPTYAGGGYVHPVYSRPGAVYAGARPSYVAPHTVGYGTYAGVHPVEGRPVTNYGGGYAGVHPVESRPAGNYGVHAAVAAPARVETHAAPAMREAPAMRGGFEHRR